jgi:cellulose biosynthesis protein BcsQ
MTATMASVANLKGGVGKSTTTLMLADGLAYFYGAQVLIVDLDAQANSSQMILTERGLQMAFAQGKGVHHLVEQFLDGRAPNIADLILPNGVTLEALREAEDRDERLGWVSILPSHPQLRLTEMLLEEKMYGAGTTPSQLSRQLAAHFTAALAPLVPLYDVILFDTPPYLSPLARAALQMSGSFVTPTLADAVSSWGTKQFTDWVTRNVATDLASRHFCVITRFRNSRYAREAEAELRNVYLKDRTFGPTIPESVEALRAMDRAALDSYNTMRGKYGTLRTDVKRLAESFAGFLATREGATPPSPVRDA